MRVTSHRDDRYRMMEYGILGKRFETMNMLIRAAMEKPDGAPEWKILADALYDFEGMALTSARRTMQSGKPDKTRA